MRERLPGIDAGAVYGHTGRAGMFYAPALFTERLFARKGIP